MYPDLIDNQEESLFNSFITLQFITVIKLSFDLAFNTVMYRTISFFQLTVYN